MTWSWGCEEMLCDPAGLGGACGIAGGKNLDSNSGK